MSFLHGNDLCICGIQLTCGGRQNSAPALLRPASAHAIKVALLLSFDLRLRSLLTVLAPLEEPFIQ